MYSIEKKNYGFKIVFGGNIKEEEMKKWYDESKRKLLGVTSPFGVFVDMRELQPLSKEAQKHLEAGQKLYKEKGMQRSVVIVSTSFIKLQFKMIAKDTGIYEWERYISTADTPNWEKAGIDWIVSGIDPDK